MRSRQPSPETVVMRADGPISAKALAQLACTLYASMAPQYGAAPGASWEDIPSAQQECAIAVARRMLRRVDARMKYILGDTRNGPLVMTGAIDFTAFVDVVMFSVADECLRAILAYTAASSDDRGCFLCRTIAGPTGHADTCPVTIIERHLKAYEEEQQESEAAK